MVAKKVPPQFRGAQKKATEPDEDDLPVGRVRGHGGKAAAEASRRVLGKKEEKGGKGKRR